jgi:hypothetical protein
MRCPCPENARPRYYRVMEPFPQTLLSPDELDAYERAHPGLAAVLVYRYEREREHHMAHQREGRALAVLAERGFQKRMRRGQWLAFGLGAASLAIAIGLAFRDSSWASFAVAAVNLVNLFAILLVARPPAAHAEVRPVLQDTALTIGGLQYNKIFAQWPLALGALTALFVCTMGLALSTHPTPPSAIASPPPIASPPAPAIADPTSEETARAIELMAKQEASLAEVSAHLVAIDDRLASLGRMKENEARPSAPAATPARPASAPAAPRALASPARDGLLSSRSAATAVNATSALVDQYGF